MLILSDKGGLWLAENRHAAEVQGAGEGNRREAKDLPFWELHRLSPYLIVQSQYVLINKRALR